jgi:hypothetical protein
MDTEDISKDQYKDVVKPLLLKVFNDSIISFAEDIPYPFSDSIESFLFLEIYANEQFHTQVFWNILRDEILKLGDTFVYQVNTLEEFFSIKTLEPDKDCKLQHQSCQAIFSSSGTWGLSGQFDGNSFLGGSYSFIKSIRESIPEIDGEFYNYLAEWKNTHYGTDISWLAELSNFLTTWNAMDYGSDNDWLTKILIRIYGEERAKELLEEAKDIGIYFSNS